MNTSLVPHRPSAISDQMPDPLAYAPAEDNAKLFFIDILAAIHRNRKLAAIVACAAAAAVILGALLIPPRYVSTATIMLDTRHEQVVDVQAVLSNLPSDTFVVDSEVKVLQSPALARKVIAKLHLDKDPEFNAALRSPSVFSQAKSTVTGAIHGLLHLFGLGSQTDVASSQRRNESVVQAFEKNLTVARSGLTYVINISFWSQDPSKSMRIANAVAQTYIDQQKDMKSEATRQANRMLQKRVAELRTEVQAKEEAVAAYKAKHGLLNVVGAPLTEQEITALDSQLANAKAQQAEEEGKLAAATSQLRDGGTNAVGEAAVSDTMRELRGQQATLIKQDAEYRRRYGPKHPARIAVERQLRAINAAIASEVNRIIGNRVAETDAARQRTASLQASINRDRKQLTLSNMQGVRLGELQRDADAVKGVYQAFLNRYQQTAAQEGMQSADAQIVAGANVPLNPSYPPWKLVIAAAVALGMLAAGLAIVLKEFFDRGVRSPDDAENAVGLPVLAVIPQISQNDPATYIVRKPMSSFAEGIRNLRTSLFLSRTSAPPKIVAVMSAVPGEGKTTTILALGRQAAMSGQRVLMIDADLRRRSLTSLLPCPVRRGIVEFVQEHAPLDECIYRDALTTAMILPVAKGDMAGKDIFFAHDLDRIFDTIRPRFDIVLIDTAPLLPLAEPRVIASHADSVVLLTQWHKTSRTAFQDAARLIRTLDVPIAGTAMTRADLKVIDSFGYSTRRYGLREAYGSYYVE